MNTCIVKYAPQSKYYSKSISLEARVNIAAGIFNVGYHFFWTKVMDKLGLYIPQILEEHLLARDRNKWIQSQYRQTNAFKSNRKRKEHTDYQKEVGNRMKDIAKNTVYSSQIGCMAGDVVPNEKEGGEGGKKKKTKLDPKLCKHRDYGCRTGECDNKKAHKTERSKHCKYHHRKLEIFDSY